MGICYSAEVKDGEIDIQNSHENDIIEEIRANKKAKKSHENGQSTCDLSYDFKSFEDDQKEDIYEHAHKKVSEVIEQHGKYKFDLKSSNLLELRPLVEYDRDLEYLGQWNPVSGTKEGQGI